MLPKEFLITDFNDEVVNAVGNGAQVLSVRTGNVAKIHIETKMDKCDRRAEHFVYGRIVHSNRVTENKIMRFIEEF